MLKREDIFGLTGEDHVHEAAPHGLAHNRNVMNTDSLFVQYIKHSRVDCSNCLV